MKKHLFFFLLLMVLFQQKTTAQIGDPAPDFTVTDVDGNTHHLYDYLEAGHIVVLDFYYTTCTPCQFYSPQVNLAYEKYGCNQAQTLFLSIDYNDTDAEVIAYDEEYHIEFPSISGSQGGGNAVVSQYGILGFPTFYVMDSSKTIIDIIDPPTLQVFDFRFQNLGIEPASCSTATHETSATGQLHLFPNPVSVGSSLHVQHDKWNAAETEYEISDPLGKVMLNGELKTVNSGDSDVAIGSIPPGIYFMRCMDKENGFVQTKMFVVK